MTKTLDSLELYTLTDKYYANEVGEVFFTRNNAGKGCAIRLSGDMVTPFTNIYGYIEYSLDNCVGGRKHIQAHRIVADLFIPKVPGANYVNHIDGNKSNNTIANLEWCTASQNEQHSYDVLGKTPWNKGKELPKGKKNRPVQCFNTDGSLHAEYPNATLAEVDGYSLKQISATCKGSQKTHKGKTWKYKME